MIVISSCIFFIVGMMIGFLVMKKLWESVWYNQGYESGYDDGYKAYERDNVVLVQDKVPEKSTKKNLVMQLQNELSNHVEVIDDKVQIKVVKKQ